MVTSYFNRLLLIAAGLGFGAFIHSVIFWQDAALLRAFVVHFGGGMVVAAPIALFSLWFAKSARSNGLFYAGLVLGLTPIATALLPLSFALSLGLALSIACVIRGGGNSANTAPTYTKLSCAVFGMLFIGGLWVGGAIGRVNPVQDLPARSDAAPQSPDVLLISIDTLRADMFNNPLAGSDLNTFKMLSERGISAPYALSSSSLTLPAHISMLSGLDSLDHGVRDNFDAVPDGLPWLSEEFLNAGYHTAGVISNGLLSRDIGFGSGFEIYGDIRRFVSSIADNSWLGAALPQSKLLKALDKPLFRAYRSHSGKGERGRGTRTNEHALEFVEQLLAEERPYFFFLHYLDPHDPYGTVAPFDMSLEQQPLDPDFIAVDKAHGVMGETAREIEHVLQNGTDAEIDVANKQIDFMRRRYAEEIMFTEQCIAEVLAAIEASGRETIVVFTSDHGEHFGEHNLMKHGNSLYKENIRVPFFMYGPGVPQGVQTSQQIQLIDIAPTLLELCNIETDQPFRGLNIVDLASAEQDVQRQHVTIDGNFFSIIMGDKKYIARWDEKFGVVLGDGLGLFDLSTDPHEINPSSEITLPFLKAIDAALERDSYQEGQVQSDFQVDMGHQLGYTGE
jgi:arylsulfatase A-like enzyme